MSEKEKQTTRRKMKTARVYVAAACVLLVTLATGFLMGWFLSKGATEENHGMHFAEQRYGEEGAGVNWSKDIDPEMTKKFMEEIQARRIETNLRWLSAIPRVAGTEADFMQARALQQMWKEQGLDSSGIETYDVLLSYPGNDSTPNKVQVLNLEDDVIYDSTAPSKKKSSPGDPLAPNFGENIPAYNAYSKSGIAEGDVVYVDFGQSMTYHTMAEKHNVTFEGKIVLSRLGGCSLREKLANAAKHGAVALLTFPNPLTEAPEGLNAVHPDTWWMPPDAERMGSTLFSSGDPLTPGYPAKKDAFRRPMEDAAERFQSKIPVQPISFEAAMAIFSHMAEDTPLVRTVWPYTNFPAWKYEHLKKTDEAQEKDEIEEFSSNSSNPRELLQMLSASADLKKIKLKNDNVSLESALRIGGRMKEGVRVRVEVYTHLERRLTHDVFGMVRGAVEPDRIVVVGSHRDAWGHGAVDPGGGTATMLEISRVIGRALRGGAWRPRRTLLFASWGAEEFGLVGSTEWVEEKLHLLRHKAVAYVNLDIVVTGNCTLEASASPLLHDLIYNAAKETPHPVFPNLFEAWSNYTVSKYSSPPRIRNLMPDSDFAPFFFNAGVASMSLYHSQREYYFYPTYHTNYDTFEYVKKFIDPTFEYHRMMGQLFTNMIHNLVDSLQLPMTTRHYSTVLAPAFVSSRTVLDLFFPNQLSHYDKFWTKAEHCTRNFTFAADDFNKQLKSVNLKDPFAVRITNDRLMLLERAFIDDIWQKRSGMMYPHVLFGPSDPSCFLVTSCCPGLNRGFCHVFGRNWTEKHTNILHEEVSILCHALNSAIDMMII